MLNMDGEFFKQGIRAGLIGMMILSVSCTRIGNYAEKRADRAAYGNIRGAQHKALGKDVPFSIDTEQGELVRQLLEMDRQAEQPQLISLADTLAIAMANSRSYQSRKESLFIAALNLSETQKEFNWDTSASEATASSSYSVEPNVVNKDVISGGTTSSVQVVDGSVTETFGENGVSGELGLSVSRTLVSGAKVTLGFTHEIVGYFSSPDQSDESSTLSLNVVQPLLNGFGPLVSKEPLRQAERDMVYAVRDFKRYQQGFVIDIASEYYSVLRALDQLNNERKNYESSMANREQTESYAKAGRIADFEAAQARQSELNAADRWTLARSSYQKALDDFRFTLGLPIDLNVEADPAELELLEQRGLVEMDISLDDAIESALSNRLDLINVRQAVEDEERNVEIVRRNFLPNLDAEYNVSRSSGDDEITEQDLEVRLNIPFDWTEKRNDYRIALINLEREQRNLGEDISDVQRDVRDLWRKLERNRSVYQNRLLSVQLSDRRVENTTLLLKQGKALTRDLLDAEDDLLSSKNEATAALVDYTINRLRFWDAIERFEIDPKGMWYEQTADDEPVATP
jgi:outer membrane protein TolC